MSRKEVSKLRSLGRFVWAVLVALAAMHHAGAEDATAEERVTVVFVDRTINWGDETITNLRLSLLCPLDTPAQTVESVELQPEPASVEADRWGQRVATFAAAQLAPGQQFAARSIADAVLRPWEVDLSAAVSAAEGIPDEIKTLYLRDGGKYALQSETIRQAAADVRNTASGAAEPDPLAIVGAAFDYVVDHLQYSRDGSWDAADKVLERGTGSCSEYTFSFIALCRANGVPARYSGGHARRAGAPLHIDRISHRWAEAYLPGLGWVPFDPTRSDGNDRYRRYFGRAPRDVLALARGDGGPGSAVDWRYESFHRWDGLERGIGVHRRGWWFAPVPSEVRAQVMALATVIPTVSEPSDKRALIQKARSIGHPFVLPWLEDFLYDPAVRVEAAEAVRDIGGPAAVLALIDCLERAGDLTGDRAIGSLLDEWTGEEFGPNRGAWQAWLNTKAFSTFTKPGAAGVER